MERRSTRSTRKPSEPIKPLKPRPIKKVQEDEEKAVENVSKKIKSNSIPVLECFLYRHKNNDRYVVIVPVPEKYINKEGNQWNNSFIISESDGASKIPINTRNIAFFMSTGTSNPKDNNFPGCWFPFTRVAESGKDWIHKLYMGKVLDKDNLRISMGIKSSPNKTKEEALVVANYMDRFSAWWQMQIAVCFTY